MKKKGYYARKKMTIESIILRFECKYSYEDEEGGDEDTNPEKAEHLHILQKMIMERCQPLVDYYYCYLKQLKIEYLPQSGAVHCSHHQSPSHWCW